MTPVPVEDLLEGRVLDEPRAGSRPAEVLAFLRAHAAEAWRAAELANTFESTPQTMGSALRRLRARGLIGKKGEYWFALPDEEAAHLHAVQRATRDLNARLGPEEPEEWGVSEQPDE